MTRICKVCASPFKDEINLLIFDGKYDSPLKIYNFMKQKYGDKFSLSHENVSRHRKRQVDKVKENATASLLRNKAIQDQIVKDVRTVHMLRTSLSTLSDQLEEVKKDIKDRVERKEVRDIINGIGKITETLLRYSDKIQSKPKFDPDTLLRKIIQCFEDIPPEYQIKFIERWKKIEFS